MSSATSPRPLTDLELTNFLAEYPQWEPEGLGLAQLFAFSDFVQALAFVNRVGALAETHNHHPDIFLSWGKVRVFWITHDTGGLSDFDLRLARLSDAAYAADAP